jgi:DNA-binding NtrC family response regulator
MAAQLARCDKATILVVDDDEIVRDYVSGILLRHGYSVMKAESGLAAIAKSREHIGPIHLLISDLQMPRMSGIQLGRDLVQERPETRVLIMSGCDPDGLNFHDDWLFIQKPFCADDLCQVVAEILHGPVRECSAGAF